MLKVIPIEGGDSIYAEKSESQPKRVEFFNSKPPAKPSALISKNSFSAWKLLWPAANKALRFGWGNLD